MQGSFTSLFLSAVDDHSKLFQTAHHETKEYFTKNKSYFLVQGEQLKDFVWPKGYGVYVINQFDQTSRRVVYIGMTGKLNKNGKFQGTTSFKDRLTRYTPYLFDPTKNLFCFEPEKIKIKGKPVGYKKSYPLKQVQIDCFVCNFEIVKQLIAPTYLESFLLQAFLLEHGNLPEANQSF